LRLRRQGPRQRGHMHASARGRGKNLSAGKTVSGG
jgi:hypothetical protein